MAFLWIRLSLLSAVTFQQTRASNEGVSLTCNDTMEVVAGNTVTLNCRMNFQDLEDNCKGLHYEWQNTSSTIPCDSDMMKFTCKWDHVTYVSLTISDVTEEENYTAAIQTNCGMAKSSAIKVQVKQPSNGRNDAVMPRQDRVKTTNVPAILGIFVTVTGVAILLVIFVTRRRTKILRHCTGAS